MVSINWFSGVISNTFNGLFLTIDALCLWMISGMYEIFLILANYRFFEDNALANFADITNKIYMVVGVMALFLLAYAMLQQIINPASKDNGNGLDLLKKIITAFILIILTPTIFNFMYSFQSAVLTGNVITKLFSEESTYDDVTTYYTFELENEYYYACSSCVDLDDKDFLNVLETEECTVIKVGSSSSCPVGEEILSQTDTVDTTYEMQKVAGREFSLLLFETFFYPMDGYTDEEVKIKETLLNEYIPLESVQDISTIIAWGTCAVTAGSIIASVVLGGPAGAAFTAAFTSAIGIACVASTKIAVDTSIINVLTTDTYTWENVKLSVLSTGAFQQIIPFSEAVADGTMSYMPFISTLSLLYVGFLLFTFSLDLAVRVIKLAFYQIIAPIPIFLSILPKNDNALSTWIKAVLTVYAEVFIRVGLMAGGVYFINLISTHFSISSGNILANLLLLIGVWTFICQAPKLFSEATGISSGNIKFNPLTKLKEGGVFGAGTGLISAGTAGVNNLVNGIEKKHGFAKTFGSTTSGITSGLIKGAYNGRKAEFSDIWKTGRSSAQSVIDSRNQKESDTDRYARANKTYFAGKRSDIFEAVKSWAGIGNVDALNKRGSMLEEGERIKKHLFDKVSDVELVQLARQEKELFMEKGIVDFKNEAYKKIDDNWDEHTKEEIRKLREEQLQQIVSETDLDKKNLMRVKFSNEMDELKKELNKNKENFRNAETSKIDEQVAEEIEKLDNMIIAQSMLALEKFKNKGKLVLEEAEWNRYISVNANDEAVKKLNSTLNFSNNDSFMANKNGEFILDENGNKQVINLDGLQRAMATNDSKIINSYVDAMKTSISSSGKSTNVISDNEILKIAGTNNKVEIANVINQSSKESKS